MGWLVGLPLGLFRLLGSILLVALRFAVPILILVAVILVVRHVRRRSPPGRGGGDPSLIGRGWPWVGVPPRSVRAVPSKGEPPPCCMPIPS